jgi:2-polyprenyl-6-methoxyphenol hydroxylase-like FAD-dependent oxidoreductase
MANSVQPRRMKRRYLRRDYHPCFGYYCGFDIVTQPQVQGVHVGVAAAYGRPDLVFDTECPDLPLAWDGDEALEFFERREPFAYLVRRDKGQVLAGWYEAADFEKLTADQIAHFPAFTQKILALADYLCQQEERRR